MYQSVNSSDIVPLTAQATRLLQEGDLKSANTLFWEMYQSGQGLDRAWLDGLIQLVILLDGAGFRPQAQHWLALASPVAQSLGLVLRPPLPIPSFLAPQAFDSSQQKWLKRYPAFESSDAYLYVIEIAGNCNLRCPSCPVGNMRDEVKPTGLMSAELFSQILDKIERDRPATPIAIHLFNWGEPLLHPLLPQFVLAVRARGWQCLVSSNLNIDRGLDKLVEAGPDLLKISISGWTQEDYGRTHVRGQIDKVKANLGQLHRLVEEQKRAGKTPCKVVIGYHLYKHNQEGARHAREFAERHGFGYMENNAIIQPIERNLDLLAGRADDVTREIAEQLIMHPTTISELNRRRRSGQFDCELRFNMTAIDVDGSVALCCGTYSRHLQIHEDFLKADPQRLEKAKYQSSFCKDCMQCGFAYTVNDVM